MPTPTASNTSPASAGSEPLANQRSLRFVGRRLARERGPRRRPAMSARLRENADASSITKIAVDSEADATTAVAFETALDQRDHGGRRLGGQRGVVGLAAKHRGERVGDVFAVERAPRRQHLVEHAAERPDVGAVIDRACPSPAPATCRRRCRGSRPAWSSPAR